MEHVPVLQNEVDRLLAVQPGEVVVDATLGLGGHARMLLEKSGKKGTLIAFEQDERNLEEAKKRLKKFSARIVFFHDNFRYLTTRVTGAGYKSVDKVLFDLGLSSPHVDLPERGFSFMKEGPLDMRYDPRSALMAADVVNSYSERELAKIFLKYGEERYAKKLAREIISRRKEKPFTTTVELAEHIAAHYPDRRSVSHPATKIFQALRIEVNDELGVLKETLQQALALLSIGGRIAVISYHSLEDRIVKQFFRSYERPPVTDPGELAYRTTGEPIVYAVTKKPVVPDLGEVSRNPRSRSAKLRVYEKVRALPPPPHSYNT